MSRMKNYRLLARLTGKFSVLIQRDGDNWSAGKIALSKFASELGEQTGLLRCEEPRRINFVELVRPRRRTRYRVTASNLIMRRT